MKKFLILNILFILLAQGAVAKKRECSSILFNMSSWDYRGGNDSWIRGESWYEGRGWISEVRSGIHSDLRHNSHTILHDESSSAVLAYIGPWQKVTLTYPHNFWETPKTIEKEIRLIATQNEVGLNSHFEAKDDLNKNIPQQRLTLIYPVRDLITLCKIQWSDKFGYDTISDYKVSPWRFFTGKVLTGSGKIIHYKTRKIIADKEEKLTLKQ